MARGFYLHRRIVQVILAARHVKSRSDLMDGVLEAVLEGVAPQIPQHAPWDESVESWKRSVRAHLIRAPGAMPAIALGGRMSPIMLESLADLAQSLEAGGFDEDQRIAAIVTIARTTKGWVIQELAHPVSREVEAITAGLPEISAEAREDGKSVEFGVSSEKSARPSRSLGLSSIEICRGMVALNVFEDPDSDPLGDGPRDP